MKTAMFNRTVATVGLTALLWLLCTLTIPGTLQAAVYFDSNFETCNVGTGNDFPCEGWDDRVGTGLPNDEWNDAANANTLEITNGGSYSGSKSVKETFRNNGLAGDAGNKPSIYHTFPGSTHVFSRIVVRKDPNFQTCLVNNVTKMWRFRGENQPGGYPTFLIIHQSNGFKIFVEGGYRDGTQLYGPSPVMTTSWQNVELEFKLNTPGIADGLVRLWVDGTLYIERLNLELVGPTPTSIGAIGQLNPSNYTINFAQVYAQCGTGSIYWDRLAVGNTRVGPASASADSTPPARPTLNPIP